jgi:hypothetical protein
MGVGTAARVGITVEVSVAGTEGNGSGARVVSAVDVIGEAGTGVGALQPIRKRRRNNGTR